jgi:RHS repeat-associated protein
MGGPNVCNHLAWSGSSGVTYNVYRNSSSPVPIDAGHRIASGLTETEYTDCGRYKNYYYAVTAVNENGESDPSNEDRASEPCGSAMAMTLPVLNAAALTESGGDPVVTKYIFFNGKRVAMDREGVVQWLVGDHLGTTSLVLKADGTVHSEARHYPYGEERWSSGTLPTDYRFTGQRSESGLGLVHMGARHYDPALGRFVSPDSIVPDFASPESLNRYTYCLGNPLVFVDPTGHASIPPWLQPIVQGLRDGARRFFDQHASVHPGSEPAPKPINRDVAQVLSTGAIVCDTLALAISGGGALAELGLAMAGSVDPLPVEELGGVAFYYAFVNPIENRISLAGTAFTAGADIFAGQTEISIESGSIRFGQDTLVSGTALFLGNALPLEGFLDTLVNGPLLWYDAQRAGENWPTYFELVCDASGCRLEIYLNETPQEEPLESGEVDEH